MRVKTFYQKQKVSAGINHI